MKSMARVMFLLAALSLFALACGLGGAATDKINKAVDSAATQVVEKISTTVATAMPEAGTVVAEAQKAATQIAEHPTATPAAEQPAAADTPAANENSAPANGQTEVAPIEVTSINNALEKLDSYQSELTVSYDGIKGDGTPTSGGITIHQETIKEPPAAHIRMEFNGDAAADMGGGGAGAFEVFSVDGTTYIQDPESGEWTSFAAGSGMDFGSVTFTADDFVDLPQNAHRDLLPKNVNGISTWHYTFTEKDIPPDPSMTVNSAKGEVWIAKDGGYPVKLVMEIDGQSTTGSEDANFFSTGKMTINYELKSVNEKFTITVPDEAKTAGSIPGGGDTGGNGNNGGSAAPNIDIPMPDDAKVEMSMAGMTSFTTSSSVQEMIDFYKNKFAALGWNNDESGNFIDVSGGMLAFTNNGNSIQVIIDGSSGDGTVNVTVMSGN